MAHDLEDVVPGRTLESLYLAPPAGADEGERRQRLLRGRQQPAAALDIKSDGPATYLAVHEALKRYPSILAKFTPAGAKDGAVTAVISGNRPRELMLDQKVRYAAYDGRLADLNSDLPASFLPLISNRWTSIFSWRGVGPIPEAEAQLLRDIVAKAHADGRRVRFWATLDDLQAFLLENDPQPSTPYVSWWEKVRRSTA